MEYIKDSVDYSVPEFFEMFEHKFPKIVIVTQGYFGEILDDIFDRDQVYQVHSTSRQKRIVANTSDRYYSIPLNYPFKVCVVKKRGKVGKEQTLQNVIDTHSLPVNIKFADNQMITVATSVMTADRFPVLTLTEEFDEVYLLANSIVDGVLGLTVVPIPLYLSKLRISEITGIKNRSLEEWKTYTKELHDLVNKNVTFNKTYGHKDIAVYDQDSFKDSTTYTYLQPEKYSSLYTTLQFNPVSGHSQPPLACQNVYEEVNARRTVPGTQSMPNKTEGETRLLTAQNQDKSRARVVKRQNRPLPALPETLQSSKTNISPAPARKNITPPKPPPKPRGHTSFVPRETEKDFTHERRQTEPTSPYKPSTLQKNTVGIESQSSAKQDNSDVTSIGRNEEAIRYTASAPTVTTTSEDTKIKPSTSTVHGDTYDDSFNVAALKIKDVAHYLSKLKLSKYIPAFKELMIDGVMLQDLDEETLMSVIGLNKIEALRLTNFAKKGHIPE